MNFREIVEKSFNAVKNHRYFWGLGVLAMLAQTGSGLEGYSFPAPGRGRDIENIDFESVLTWIRLHQSIILLSSIVLLIILVLLIYISLRAQASQMIAVKKIEHGEPFKNFASAFKASEGFPLKLFALGLLVGLAVLVWILITLFLPIMAIALIPSVLVYIFCGLLILVGSLGSLVLVFLLPVSLALSERIIVLEKKNTIEAFEGGIRLLKHNLGTSVLAILIELLIAVVIGLSASLVLLIAGGTIVLLGWGAYALLGTIASIVYAVALGIPFLAITLLLGGIFSSFYSSYWTLFYLKLKK